MSLFKHDKAAEKEIKKYAEEEIKTDEIKNAVRNEKLYERIIAEEMAGIRSCEQNNLVIVSEKRGAEWLGFPSSYVVIDGFYYIKFLPRVPSFSDIILGPLKKMLGIKRKYYVLKAHSDLVRMNEDTITVFVEKLTHDVETNIITAIAPASSIIEKAGFDSYESLLKERDILKEKLHIVLEQEKKNIQAAMEINPYIRLYRKGMKENKEEGEKEENLFGFELGSILGGDQK